MAAAGINRQINFQGKIVNKTDGTNITDNTYSFTFKFYDAASAGTQLPSGTPWSETQSLAVSSGIFRAALGAVTAIPAALDFNSDSLYLDITFNGETFTTRVRMGAVPYAFNAEKVGGIAGSAIVVNNPTAAQVITSTQTSGTVLTVTDTTGLSAAIVGQAITLSGTGAFDQTGLQFNLSGASGSNLNDIVGTGSTWKVSKSGALTVASCTGCGAGGGYNLVQDEGVGLTARTTLNFIGAGVTCVDNAGNTRTDCTISSSGGGVSLGPSAADSVTSNNNVIWTTTSGTGALLKLQKSGSDKFVVANSGGLTISGTTNNIVKTTTGTTNPTDFSLAGATLTNVTSQSDTITINDGTVPSSGNGTMATSTVVTAAAMGAGGHAIQRDDGQYVIIHGGAVATGSVWNGSSTTMTSITIATGATNPGAGAISLKRPDGRYLLVHGNGSAGLTSVFDPYNVVAVTAGPAICGGGAATTGTNAFRRQNGKYVILCGGVASGAWGLYDPNVTPANAAGAYSAGATTGTVFGAGAHALLRDDGTFLVFSGGGSTASFIYNPYTSATGTMTASGLTAPSAINTGATSIRRADGKYLVIPNAVNASFVYDPTGATGSFGTLQSGAGFGPTAALADGAQVLWREDWKYLLITGSTNVTNIIDVSKTDNTQFTAGPNLLANAAAGIHAFMRPDGLYQIIRGGGVTTTDTYDIGYIIGGNGSGTQLASYETECIASLAIATSSAVRWNANAEGRMWVQARSGTSCPLGGSYKDILYSGDLLRPTAGDTKVQLKVFFQRTFPNHADQVWGLRRGLSQVEYRRVSADPTLYDVEVDNSAAYHRTQFELSNNSDMSGPVSVNLINNADRTLSLALDNSTKLTTQSGTTVGFYYGAPISQPPLTTTASAGGILMRRPDNKYVFVAGNIVTANAQVYDPVAQTFTNLGTTPAAGTGQGAMAFKRPDGKFLLVLGNQTTTTSIFDPVANTFAAGPVTTAAVGRGGLLIPLPNGRVLIMHGNGTTASSIYDPYQNTMIAGPISTAGLGEGSLAIPRPDGTYMVVIGITSWGVLTTTTNLFDPYNMVFTATGAPAITTGTGPGAHAFQRSDGMWVIVHGGGTAVTMAATNRTQLYNPYTNQMAAGPTLIAVAGRGAFSVQRADGTWGVFHGGGVGTSSIYLEKTGAWTTGIGWTGSFVTGPALTQTVSDGGMAFQVDNGQYVVINGMATTTVSRIDAGYIDGGVYKSEQMAMADLGSGSTLTWKANPLLGISAEARTAVSQAALTTASFHEVTNGGLINPTGATDTWVQVNFNFKRSFPTNPGVWADVWYTGSGGQIPNQIRTIATPTLQEYKINKDTNLVNLQSDGLSVFRVSSSGDIFTASTGSVNTGGADLAERYTSDQTLVPGEVVALDPANNHGVKRSQYQYQPDVLGVVSTAPGFVAGTYTKDSYPIGLIGRVPVLVSTENGPVRAGDFLAASSLPGYAMRATKAGRVLGTALENLEGGSTCPDGGYPVPGRLCATVMMFVDLTFFWGEPVETAALATPRPESGVAVLGATEKQDQILAFLEELRDQEATSSAGQGSEVFTGRVSATKEVITPQVITDLLVAKKIKADSIEGLQLLVGSASVASGAAVSTKPDWTWPTTATFSGVRIFQAWVSGGLLVSGPSEFSSDVKFTKTARPVFGADTAGWAVIKKGANHVDVTFVRDYADLPMVTASLRLEPVKKDDKVDLDKNAQLIKDIFAQGYFYLVVNQTKQGFTIVLDKKAADDLTFSWMALAVDKPTVFVSPEVVDLPPLASPAAVLGTSSAEPATTSGNVL